MKIKSCASFFLAALPFILAKEADVSKSADSSASASSSVVILNEGSYDHFIGCGHCKRLEPEYAKAAELLQESGIKLASVNCVENEKLCTAHGIRGYPTMMVYNNGDKADYEGPREAAGIVKFMKKQIMPTVSELKVNEIDAFSKGDDVVVFGVFAPGSKEETEFKKVAETMKNEVSFGQIKQGVYITKKFDEPLVEFSGKDINEKTLTEWINTERVPLMDEISPENYGTYIKSGKPMAYLFYSKDSMRKEYGSIVEEVMRSFKGKINAVYIDADKYEAHAKNLALPSSWPAFIIHEIEGDLKYPFTGKLNKEELSKFISDYSAGKVEPTYKSQDIPEKETGSVKTIVFKNFNKVVMDTGKDVLVKFYAPWCGACQRNVPIYEKVAKAYAQHSDKIIIAEMDATANDLPKSSEVKLTKFPTFILFKAGSKKEQIEYEREASSGDSAKGFVDFINKHASNKVEVTIDESDSNSKEEL